MPGQPSIIRNGMGASHTPKHSLWRSWAVPIALAVGTTLLAWWHQDWPLDALALFTCFLLGWQIHQNERLQRFNRVQDETIKAAERKHDEERLRSALLSSVSHDLKTPLVTMLGAATSLRDLQDDLSLNDRAELLDSIISESQRLEAYIQNLLDMTRLGHGTLSLSRGWVTVREIYNVVSKRIMRQHPGQSLQFVAPPELTQVNVHAALIEQAMFNGIDNACKACAREGVVQTSVSIAPETKMLYIRICDQGPGLPPSEWERVFDQFYTFSQGDRYEKGTGLGLSICRSIFRVHGGDARIEAPPSGFKHCLTLSLPIVPQTHSEKRGEHAQDSGD
jgi:two-component system sensor histidine kinase KdpD